MTAQLTDLVDNTFIVADVVLEVKYWVSVIHGIVDRRTCVFVVFTLRQHNLHTTHTQTHTHTLRLLSHPRDNNDIRTRTVGLMVEYQTRN